MLIELLTSVEQAGRSWATVNEKDERTLQLALRRTQPEIAQIFENTFHEKYVLMNRAESRLKKS